MNLKDYFLELFYRIGDYTARKILEHQDKYFKILFKKFEKKMYKGWQLFERVEDEMDYYGEHLIIKVSKPKQNQKNLFLIDNYSKGIEITK